MDDSTRSIMRCVPSVAATKGKLTVRYTGTSRAPFARTTSLPSSSPSERLGTFPSSLLPLRPLTSRPQPSPLNSLPSSNPTLRAPPSPLSPSAPRRLSTLLALWFGKMEALGRRIDPTALILLLGQTQVVVDGVNATPSLHADIEGGETRSGRETGSRGETGCSFSALLCCSGVCD